MKKIIELEKGNNDNIFWYEDDYFTLIAPCYYPIKNIISLVKKYNPNQNLILNNILEMTGNYFIH